MGHSTFLAAIIPEGSGWRRPLFSENHRKNGKTTATTVKHAKIVGERRCNGRPRLVPESGGPALLLSDAEFLINTRVNTMHGTVRICGWVQTR